VDRGLEKWGSTDPLDPVAPRPPIITFNVRIPAQICPSGLVRDNIDVRIVHNHSRPIHMYDTFDTLVGCVAQWLECWSETGELSCPTLDLQLTGDHLCG